MLSRGKIPAMADELKGRNINSRDEEVAETPWGPDVPVHRVRAIGPGLRAAYERYRLARAALRGGASDASSETVDAIDPISPTRRIRDIRF